MAIDVSKFEREISAEYMRLYANEIRPENAVPTKQIVDIAATVAAIAIKLHEESK